MWPVGMGISLLLKPQSRGHTGCAQYLLHVCLWGAFHLALYLDGLLILERLHGMVLDEFTQCLVTPPPQTPAHFADADSPGPSFSEALQLSGQGCEFWSQRDLGLNPCSAIPHAV